MKRIILTISILLILVINNSVLSQGVAQPLTIQGIDQFNAIGARNIGMGGVSLAASNDVTTLFSNPAILSQINSLSFRVGGSYVYNNYEQVQHWIPNELYAELSILFENKELIVTKTFDTIKPDWDKNFSYSKPSMVAAAYPFEILGIGITAGLGYAEIVNLDHYFQNNNALNPNIGQMRPEPIPRPNMNDTVFVNWFQYINRRDGSIYGITPALSFRINENLSFGGSLIILNGKSDDLQERHDRGFFKLTTVRNSSSSFNNFRLDSVYYHEFENGSSTYSGLISNIGIYYKEKFYSVGLSIRPPYEIKREWDKEITVIKDTVTSVSNKSGVEKLSYPFNFNIGLALYPTKNWTIGIDFDRRNYAGVKYHPNSDTSYNPWLSSQRFRLGVEYQALNWLFLRGGFREDIRTVAAEGAGILQNPVKGSIYTFGAGIKFGMFSFDLAYEYLNTEYQDTWLSNINYNRKEKHLIIFEAGITF